MKARLGIALCATAALVASCSPRGASMKAVPVERAVSAAEESVRLAAEKAEQASEPTVPYWLPARLNRAGCDCPDWEVMVWGVWRRADLLFSETTLPDGISAAESADGTRMWVLATESDRELTREDGRRFLRFEISRTSALAPAP